MLIPFFMVLLSYTRVRVKKSCSSKCIVHRVNLPPENGCGPRAGLATVLMRDPSALSCYDNPLLSLCYTNKCTCKQKAWLCSLYFLRTSRNMGAKLGRVSAAYPRIRPLRRGRQNYHRGLLLYLSC